MVIIKWTLFVLFVFAVRCEQQSVQSINFDSFKYAIRTAQQYIAKAHILALNSTKHDCALPRDAIMFTYTNAKNVPLLELMVQSLEVNRMKSCLLPQLVVACFDLTCTESCSRLGIPLCPFVDAEHIVSAITNSSSGGATGYMKGAYFFFTYVKHELMQAALSVVNNVLFMDVDILLLQNPWPEMFFPANISHRIEGGYDLRYQRERGEEESCAGFVNTGILFMRNTTKVQRLVAHMLTFRHQIVTLQQGHDQKYFNRIIGSHNLPRCTLPPVNFASRCLFTNSDINYLDHTRYRAADVTTFHATCCRYVTKEQVLRKALYHAQSNKTMSLINFTASE